MKISHSNIVVTILVMVIVVGITGTLVVLDKSPIKPNLITGAATNSTTGTSTITVVSQSVVTNRVSSVAFGSGYVNSTCNNCTMNTANGFENNTFCCAGFNNVTAGFLIENTGNENVSLNMTCTGSCTAATFIGGTSPTPLFQFKVVTAASALNKTGDATTDTANSCSSGGNWNYSAGWNTLDASTNFFLCGRNDTEYFMGSEATRDAVVIDLRVLIPEDASISQQTATVTFEANSGG